MVSGSFRCDPNRLRLLLDDELPEEGQIELAEHIERCPSCRRRLESLAADAELWGQVGQMLRGEAEGESPTAVLPGRGGAGGEELRGLKAPASGGPPLDFLSPADDPQKLGRLGPYEIVEVIGSGGMGVVLKGFDSALNRFVAIKVLAPQLASSASARRRFAREAQAAAAVVHEHVIAIHAVDAGGPTPYLVMPYVAGRSLQARLEESGPLELREILRIAAQTAAGLAAAHAQGLVHRDIKPANILLENGVERVMITDFGLARAIDDASLTQSGVVAGTPQYMAPEQADGKTVDHRADLFSLGSVIYAMCTGRSPFRAETTMAVLRRICEGTPRAIREINPEIPEWLAEIVAKLLKKAPEDRFQSAAEVADLLGRHLAHLQHPTAVPAPGRLEGVAAGQAQRSRRRRRLAAGVALLLLVGWGLGELTGVTGVTARVGRRLRDHRWWRAGRGSWRRPTRRDRRRCCGWIGGSRTRWRRSAKVWTKSRHVRPRRRAVSPCPIRWRRCVSGRLRWRRSWTGSSSVNRRSCCRRWPRGWISWSKRVETSRRWIGRRLTSRCRGWVPSWIGWTRSWRGNGPRFCVEMIAEHGSSCGGCAGRNVLLGKGLC